MLFCWHFSIPMSAFIWCPNKDGNHLGAVPVDMTGHGVSAGGGVRSWRTAGELLLGCETGVLWILFCDLY
jgi:hypothetical protein